GRAVSTAVGRRKVRLSPRATLYSPPPSQTLKAWALRIRPSPGSRRSITSPRAARSHRLEPPADSAHECFASLIARRTRTATDRPPQPSIDTPHHWDEACRDEP